MKKYITDFVLTFAVTLVVSAVVTYVYSLIAHGAGHVDWETAIRFAIILGIVLTWLKQRG